MPKRQPHKEIYATTVNGEHEKLFAGHLLYDQRRDAIFGTLRYCMEWNLDFWDSWPTTNSQVTSISAYSYFFDWRNNDDGRRRWCGACDASMRGGWAYSAGFLVVGNVLKATHAIIAWLFLSMFKKEERVKTFCLVARVWHRHHLLTIHELLSLFSRIWRIRFWYL
jgi:hypothetical protein